MTGRVAADFVALENGTKDFEHVLDVLRKTLAGLDQDLRASLGRWEGEASRAYWPAHDRWQAAADDMAERLGWLHKVLLAAHRNYRSSLDANLKMWEVV
jgi:WXG100 family type VII secretion target